jgi:hypothetical protein
VKARKKKPRWGPRKLRQALQRANPRANLPSIGTFALIFRRNGLIRPHRRRRKTPPFSAPLAHATAPNSVWCRAYGISRQTGYKWLGRYLDAHGRIEALADRSRRPLSSPDAIPDDIVDLLVKARKKRPYWGPVRLRKWLVNRGEDDAKLPAPSTIGSILKRHGLVRPRQRRRRTPPTMASRRSKPRVRTRSGASTIKASSAPPTASSATRSPSSTATAATSSAARLSRRPTSVARER